MGMSRYTANQAALADSAGGAIASELKPGDAFTTHDGRTGTVWRAWSPDLKGDAEANAAKHNFPFDARTHNTTVGVTLGGRVEFIDVLSCDQLTIKR